MSKYIPGNQKHLTLDDRIYIQNELSKGTSFKAVSYTHLLHAFFIKIRINHTLFDGNRCHDQDLRSILSPTGNR